MKKDSFKKITTPRVVIFSFLSLFLFSIICIVMNLIISGIVLSTDVPESFLKIGTVATNGVGVIVSTAFLVNQSRIKGIYGSCIIFFVITLIKVTGNAFLKQGGYLTLNGLVGLCFLMIFSLVGGVIGGMIKKKK